MITRRDTFAGNALATSMLKMVGFTAWDINALSVGAGLETWCYLDGFISAQDIRLRSEILFGDKICVYGHGGVELYNDNDFTDGGTGQAYAGRSWDSLNNDRCKGFELLGKQSDICSMESNPGLDAGSFVSDDVFPTRAIGLGDQIQALYDAVPYVNRFTRDEWTDDEHGRLKNVGPYNILSLLTAEDYGTHTSFYLGCESDDTRVLKLPEGNYRNITIVTNCLLEIQGGGQPALFDGVTVAARPSATSIATTR